MSLDPDTFLAVAAACAPDVAPQTLLAVAKVESGLNPLAIGVNGGSGAGRRPTSPEAAIRLAQALVRSGRNIDVGLAQINVRNLGWLGLSVAEAFDPCANLAAAARILTDGYRRAGVVPGGEQLSLRIALSYYNTGTADRGFRNGYVARVVAAGRPPGEAKPSATPARTAARRPPPAATSFVIHPQAGGQP
ncbi:MAG: conjugal transfer protein [Phenylobacterium zucineum]|nr:MAG: conjugal transfer protein [Phenylobacterium zucineum]